MSKRPEQSHEADKSNGWESFAEEFISRSHLSTVGADLVEAWARNFPPHAQILDLACGPGTPRSEVLADKNFALYAVDASPSLVNAYKAKFPKARVACEPVEESTFFSETFDGVLVWGVLFLLDAPVQRALFPRIDSALRPGGSFLFTAPWQSATWEDSSTKRRSVSLGKDAYWVLLDKVGLSLRAEYDDAGGNHYYEAVKPRD